GRGVRGRGGGGRPVGGPTRRRGGGRAPGGGPGPPRARPPAGLRSRSNVPAATVNGAGSLLPISMRWPSPPRNSPAPPESGRYSLTQNTSGDSFSVISTGTTPTPLGHAVVLSPSLPGRAPVPPSPTFSTLNDLPWARVPAIGSTQIDPALSAGTRPSSAWASAPNITSGSIWPITCRAVTGAGRSGATQVPSSTSTWKGSSEPAVFGIAGAMMHLRPKTEYAS